MSGHIERLWETYRRILPADAGHVQVLETKRAFFAGAKALMDAFMGPLLDDQEEPTAADMQRMQEIEDELAAFGRSGGLL